MRASGSEAEAGEPTRTVEYTEAEERQIAAQLFAVQQDIQAGQHSTTQASPSYVIELHRQAFNGIDHAGRVRVPGWGSEHKTFGPNRSVHRSETMAQLEASMERARRMVASVLENPDAPDRDQHALHIAVWGHAEVIRIHPFEDGNGRTSRLLLDSMLVTMGLQPIPLETAKETYFDCLNHYFRTDDIQALLDLFIELAGAQLLERDEEE